LLTFQTPHGVRYFEESALSSAANVLLRREEHERKEGREEHERKEHERKEGREEHERKEGRERKERKEEKEGKEGKEGKHRKEGKNEEFSQFIQLPKGSQAKFAWVEINQKENKITSVLNFTDPLLPPLPVKYDAVGVWKHEDGKKLVVEYIQVHV